MSHGQPEERERDRLLALAGFDILNTPPEPAFDELAALAAHLCGVPMALVSLVDDERQWFKARHGLDLVETSREVSFCAYALDGPEMLVVPDVRLDERFADNPMVVGEPHLRFYAGAPLVTSDGYVLGTLCLLDVEPRCLTESQCSHLRILAGQVVSQLEMRRQARRLAAEAQARVAADTALREQQRMLDGILDHTDVLIFAKDLDGRFVMANRAIEHTIPIDGGMYGRTDYELFPADAADGYRRNDTRILESREWQVFSEELVHPDGSTHTYRATKFPLLDESGAVIGIGGVSTDVTELAASRAASEEAEQRWRTLVEQSPAAIVVIDADGRIAYANTQALALLGAPTTTGVEGRSAVTFLPHRARAEILRIMDDVIEGGPALLARQCPMNRMDGTEVTVEFDAIAITYRHAPAVQVELRDVTASVVAHAELTESERRFRAVFDDSPVAMALVDTSGRWVQTNAALAHLMGVTPAQLLGGDARNVVHPDDRHLLATHDVDGSDVDGMGRSEVRIVRPDGQIRWVWASTRLTTARSGEELVLAVIQDVTDRKIVERSLHESEADLAAVAAIARCAHTGSDPRSVIVEKARELAGASTVVLLEAIDDDTLVITASAGIDAVGVTTPLAGSSLTSYVWQTGEPVFLSEAATDPRVDHALLALDATVSLLAHPVVLHGGVEALLNVTWRHRVPDRAARAVRSVQTIADETGAALQTSRLRDELERLASTDPLTGALNRRAWDARLRAMAVEPGSAAAPFVIAVIDLDNFKSYNDTYGHSAGDELLRSFAAMTRAALRPSDVFARWGGEEFVVALSATNLVGGDRILNRVRLGVPDGQTCSIGFTEWNGVESLPMVMARADAALYQAKKGGRDQLARA